VGRLAAAVSTRGGQPRNRTMDLAIAATANVHKVPLLTENVGDFQIIRACRPAAPFGHRSISRGTAAWFSPERWLRWLGCADRRWRVSGLA
jgi:hypothetical protein